MDCLNDDRAPGEPCKLALAGLCKGRQRYACRKDRGGCGKSYMDDANPVGNLVKSDGLSKADRVRVCFGNMGTSGTGKTWYVIRDREAYTQAAIVAVVLCAHRSVHEEYPGRSIALLSSYPARTRRWIIEEYKIPMY